MERESIGIENFDNMVQGGLPNGGIIGLSGPPGAGKSIFTLHFLLEGARKAKGWKEKLQAATYCLENKVALDEGRKWIDQSLDEEKNYWNLTVKAKYLANDGQLDGARKIMGDAIAMGKAMDRIPYNIEEMEQQLKEWKNQ